MANNEFNLVDPIPDLVEFQNEATEQIGRLRMVAADHDGQLKKLDALIASIHASLSASQSSFAAWQSSFAAWQNTAIGIAAAIGIAVALLGGFEVWELSVTGSLSTDTTNKFDAASRRFDAVDSRLRTIEFGQKTLPAELSQQMISLAASFAAVRGEQIPPVRERPSRPK